MLASIGAPSCVTFQPSRDTFPVISGQQAAPVFVSPDDWLGVQRAADDFVADIQRVTGIKPTLANLTISMNSTVPKGSLPIFVGTLGHSALIDSIVNSTGLDVSGVRGVWEAFVSKEVQNPMPSVERGYVIAGADKRGTIYALYEHSQQSGEFFSLCNNQIVVVYRCQTHHPGVSPWHWYLQLIPYIVHDYLLTAHSCHSGGLMFLLPSILSYTSLPMDVLMGLQR